MITEAKADRDNTMLHLRLGFLSLRYGDLAGGPHYEDAASEFEWATQLEPTWPYAWYGLGMAELAIGDSQVAIVTGLKTMVGKDAMAKAADAYARSAEVDPGFVQGLVELSNTALAQRVNIRLDVALDALRQSAGTQSAANPAGAAGARPDRARGGEPRFRHRGAHRLPGQRRRQGARLPRAGAHPARHRARRRRPQLLRRRGVRRHPQRAALPAGPGVLRHGGGAGRVRLDGGAGPLHLAPGVLDRPRQPQPPEPQRAAQGALPPALLRTAELPPGQRQPALQHRGDLSLRAARSSTTAA